MLVPFMHAPGFTYGAIPDFPGAVACLIGMVLGLSAFFMTLFWLPETLPPDNVRPFPPFSFAHRVWQYVCQYLGLPPLETAKYMHVRSNSSKDLEQLEADGLATGAVSGAGGGKRAGNLEMVATGGIEIEKEFAGSNISSSSFHSQNGHADGAGSFNVDDEDEAGSGSFLDRQQVGNGHSTSAAAAGLGELEEAEDGCGEEEKEEAGDRVEVEYNLEMAEGPPEDRRPPKSEWAAMRSEPMCSMMLVRMLCGFAFFSLFDVFPLWVITDREVGGLNLRQDQVGMVLSLSAFIQLFYTSVVMGRCLVWLGVRKSLYWSSLFVAVCLYILPNLPNQWWCALVLALTSSGLQAMSSAILAMTNNVTEPSRRGMVNGVATTIEAVGKASGPAMCASIFAWTILTYGKKGHSHIFVGLSVIAIVVAIFAYRLPLYVDEAQYEEGGDAKAVTTKAIRASNAPRTGCNKIMYRIECQWRAYVLYGSYNSDDGDDRIRPLPRKPRHIVYDLPQPTYNIIQDAAEPDEKPPEPPEEPPEEPPQPVVENGGAAAEEGGTEPEF